LLQSILQCYVLNKKKYKQRVKKRKKKNKNKKERKIDAFTQRIEYLAFTIT